MTDRCTDTGEPFAPLCETNQAVLVRHMQNDAERALYRSRILHMHGRVKEAYDALIPFLGVPHQFQKELQHAVDELKEELGTAMPLDTTTVDTKKSKHGLEEELKVTADLAAAEDVVGPAAQFHQTMINALFERLVEKERCMVSWRRLAHELRVVGAAVEADYIEHTIVYCLSLRDRPCHAATGALRLAADELRAMEPLALPSEAYVQWAPVVTVLAVAEPQQAQESNKVEERSEGACSDRGGADCVDSERGGVQAADAVPTVPFFEKYFATPVLKVFGGRKFEAIGTAHFDSSC